MLFHSSMLTPKEPENCRMNSVVSRQTLRKTIRTARNKLSKEQQHSAGLLLLERLSKHPKIVDATNIAIYLANDGEIDPSFFIQWCWQNNKQVYLPRLHPFSSGNLIFLNYDEQTEFVNNQYGIAEPKLNVQQLIPLDCLDVICTPLVAFDALGNRLGMGGGFYDRTMARWHQQTNNRQVKPYPIGLAHNCQQVDHIPTECWDIPLPEIITPRQEFYWR